MKLVVTDLDGTLFQKDQTILKSDLKAINEAEKKGVKTIVATGRQYLNATNLLKKAGFLPEYIICDNGCSIYSTKDNKQLFSFSLTKEKTKEVLTILEENNYYYSISSDKFRIEKNNCFDLLQNEFNRNKERIPDLDPYHLTSLVDLIKAGKNLSHYCNDMNEICNLQCNFYNITAISFDPERIKYGQSLLSKVSDISIVSSAYNNFEILHKDCSKGNAIKYLASYLDINLSKVMTIGDNYNDISMFNVSENSVAMGNATKDIQELCKYTTVPNCDGGVGYALKNFI